MSTILDALKKSEQERKLKKVPTLNDMSAPQEKSFWPYKIIIVLLLSFILLTIFIFVNGSNIDNQFFYTSTNSDSKKVVLDNETLGLNTTGTKEVSSADEIVVNVVSYAVTPEQRFVVINGKLYREGDFIKPGLIVETIKQKSVVLNQRGRRLELQP